MADNLKITENSDEDELLILEMAMRQSYADGDAKNARKYAEAYKKLKAGSTTASGAFALNTMRGFDKIVSGTKEIGSLAADPISEKGRAFREEIRRKEAAKEAMLEPYRSEHPVASFAGGMVAPTLFSGGRSLPAAVIRGGLTGLLSYTPDPETRMMQAASMAALGGAGQQMAASKPLGKQASALNMRTMPEENSYTLLPKDKVRNLQAFQTQAFEVSKFNQGQISQQALRELGDTGNRWTADTIANARARASALFDDALGSRENVFVNSNEYNNMLSRFSIDKTTRSTGKKAAAGWAKDIHATLVKNKGIMSVNDYHRLRSDITDEITSASKAKKKQNLGELVDWLDSNVGRYLSPETKSKFDEGRRLWKNYTMYKTLSKRDKGIDYETGLIDPNKLNRILANKDEYGYLLNNNPSRVYQMLKVNNQIAGHRGISTDATNNLGSLRIGFGGGSGSLGYYSNRLINEPAGALGLAINRLPADLITDIPAGVVPPLIANAPVIKKQPSPSLLNQPGERVWEK